jgi:SOS response regulatory protein OraA/RecX
VVDDRLLAAWGVTREDIETVFGTPDQEGSYAQAKADAERKMRELEEHIVGKYQEIADGLNAQLRAQGLPGEIKFKTEKLR